MVLDDRMRSLLVARALAATTSSFLTGLSGTRYGAATLTASGRVFSAGQYSSYNHVTNVHAEQAAIILATMAGDPNILALAVASTSNDDTTTPCGICRQIMLEHAARTGQDFEILMARRGGGYAVSHVKELLPHTWLPGTIRDYMSPSVKTDARLGDLVPTIPGSASALRVGDHVLLADGSIAITWDPALQPHSVLLKLKYTAADANGAWRKLAHSFTQPFEYEHELWHLGWARPTPFGGVAAVAHVSETVQRIPIRPLAECEPTCPGLLLDLFADAGVTADAVAVTGSRSIGLSRTTSDWDLVVHCCADTARNLRSALARAIRDDDASVPVSSNTWRLLDKSFPGGKDALLRQERFVDTIAIKGVSVALIFVPASAPDPLITDSWWATGRTQVEGVITAADLCLYKRAQFEVRTGEHGNVEVTSYHKTANLLMPGDRVALQGWELRAGARRRIVQLCPIRDNIVWISPRNR